MFLIRVLWTSRLKHRAINQWRMSRASENGEGGGRGCGGRYALVSTVSSATGRLFLSTGLIYRPALRALWIYAAPFASSRYSLVFLAVAPPSPPVSTPTVSPFADFGSGGSESYSRYILICVRSARTRDPWDTHVSRNV